MRPARPTILPIINFVFLSLLLITSVVLFGIYLPHINLNDKCDNTVCPTNACLQYDCISPGGDCVVVDVVPGCCNTDSDCPQTVNTTFISLCGSDSRCYLVENGPNFTETVSQTITSNIDLIREGFINVTDVLNKEPTQYYWTGFLAVDGITNLVQDYSVEPRNAWLDNPFNTSIIVNRMLVELLGPGSLTATEYGTIATLPNGVSITYEREDGELIDLTADSPIRRNVDWAAYTFDARPDTYGSGDNGFSVRWSFNRADPSGLRLLPGNKIRAMLRDNFSGLTLHRFLIQGYIEN